MTQGWDIEKQRRTLQVSISKREPLAGTLVFQASERNKNRRGRGTYHLLPFVIPAARLLQLLIRHVVTGLRWAAGHWALARGHVLKAIEGVSSHPEVGFGGGRPSGGGGVLLQGLTDDAAVTFEAFGSDFPACQ